MKFSVALLLLALLLFICLANGDPYREEPSETEDDDEDTGEEDTEDDTELTAIVQGYVYCLDCQGSWSKSSSAALVGVQCKLEDGSVRGYGEGYTGDDGYFHIKFPYRYESVYDGAKFCKALLLASPDSSCNTITNVGQGKKGAKLKFTKIFMREVYFTTEAFALMPYCPKDYDMAPPTY